MNLQNIEGLPSRESDVDLFGIDYSDLMMEDSKEVGRGSFGKVLQASYFGTTVAVKVLSSLVSSDPDYHKFMQREIRILKNMRHPNIVQYIGSCKNNDRHMIVTEYIDGGDLHHFMKTKPNQLTWQLKLKLALDIASAFSYLHSKQIIFRDLKSKNVLVEEYGSTLRAKLCDFGFSRVIDGSKEKQQQNYLTLCGSECTMAPEVIVASHYDETCDIYSYGILLYELICGSRVVKFELKRTPENAFDMDLERAESFAPPTCPKPLLELARICCSYEPKKRPSFKTIALGLNDLVSKPIESIPVKGGSAVSVSIKQDDTSSSISSSSTTTTDNENVYENTGSVIYNGTVQYNSVVYNNDTTRINHDADQPSIDYGGQNKKHNRILSPSFFSPPLSMSSPASISTTNSNTTSVDNSSFSISPPSALLTNLTINEIRYRDPSFFENPDDIIEMKKRNLSSPNLTNNNSTTTTAVTNSTPSTTTTQEESSLAATWHPETQTSQQQQNQNKKKKKKNNNKKKNKKR